MTLWLVRAGAHGDQEQGAYDNSIVTIGWNELPDLSNIKDKNTLHQLYLETYGPKKKRSVANRVGQIWNFVINIEKGDLVALPLKSQSSIVIGEVLSDYEYKEYSHNIKHTRKVKWLKPIPRSEFDQDILFSLGAFMTVCRIRRNDAENRVRKMLSGEKIVKTIPDTENDEDAETEFTDIEQFAKDQINKFLEAKFAGHNLARLINEIFRAQGYVTSMSPPGADGGVDVLVGSGPLGFDKPKICVQVKSSKSPVDVGVLRQLEGAAKNFGAEHGIFVAWGGFTKAAIDEAKRSFFSTRLWEQGQVLEEIIKNYEKFNDEFKAELPLKRIWTIVSEDDTN